MAQQAIIGLLHPGAMGHRIGAAAVAAGHRVLWASEGRSPATAERATAVGLEDTGSISALVRQAQVILSICPPDAAEGMARDIAALRFTGLYVDANAISPETMRKVARVVEAGGATAVDASIIGRPPTEAGHTRLHVSGEAAARVVPLFAGSILEVANDGPLIGSASALKVCYSAYSKGTSALLLAILSVAEAEGVAAPLMKEWERSRANVINREMSTAQNSLDKAWRFVGEMEEIAATFASHGVPDGFHLAAAEIYARLAGFKDGAKGEDVALALRTILEPKREAAE